MVKYYHLGLNVLSHLSGAYKEHNIQTNLEVAWCSLEIIMRLKSLQTGDWSLQQNVSTIRYDLFAMKSYFGWKNIDSSFNMVC